MVGRTGPRGAKAAFATWMLAMLLSLSAMTGVGGFFDDDEPTRPTLLMVDIQDMTTIEWIYGGLVTGSNGGGVAMWNGSGELAELWTVVDGLPSNHIRDLAAKGSSVVAATRGGMAIYNESEGWWTPAAGPDGDMVSVVYDGTDFCWALSANGTGYGSSYDLDEWTPIDLPSPLPLEGWKDFVVDETHGVLSNGTGIVILDWWPYEATVPVMPDGGEVLDIALRSGLVFVAMEGHPDIYDIEGGRWLDPSLTSSASWYATDWVAVDADDEDMWVCSSNGTVVSLDLADPFGDANWVHEGTVGDGSANLEVRQVDARTGMVATNQGAWDLFATEVTHYSALDTRQLRSNDVMSVASAAGLLWTLTDEGMDGLTFDSVDRPTGWIVGQQLDGADDAATIDAVELGGVVYIAGTGSGIRTWDTFTSSKTSRWGQIHHQGDPGLDDVRTVAVLGGTLYTGGAYGVDRMVGSGEAATFEGIPDGPGEVHSMVATYDGTLLVGAEDGLWTYRPEVGWDPPSSYQDVFPMGPVRAMTSTGSDLYVAVGDTVYWQLPDGTGTSVRLSTASDPVSALVASDTWGGPVWAVVGGNVVTFDPEDPAVIDIPTRDALGDAIVRDVEFGPGGTIYLATDSGVHMVAAFRSTWREWTTSNGLSANDLRDLEMEPDGGSLWVCAYGGVDVMDTSTMAIQWISTSEGLPSNLVYDVMVRDGDIWVGTDVGGAARRSLTGTTWQVYNASTGLIADDVQALGRIGDHVLFGTDEGVTVLDLKASTFSSHTASSTHGRLPDNWVWCVLEGPGEFFVGTAQGLGIYHPSTDAWELVSINEVLGKNVRAMAWDDDGRLWIGHDDGLSIMMDPHGSEARSIGPEEGLPGDEVLSLYLDSEGMMWVGTSAGVALVGMDGRVHGTFSTMDGLVHDRVTAVAEGPDGTMWLATAGGLSRMEKDRWDLRPQYMGPGIDLPDVYVTLTDVLSVPDRPTEGEEVAFEVTVRNPSGDRVITTVTLFDDLYGGPGYELSSAIAYTEGGSSYTVELPWVAAGGEQILWVVVDPNDKVPESNERNNIVSISIHVNRPPELRDATHELVRESLDAKAKEINVTVEVVYSDPDGDPPRSIEAYYPGPHPSNVSLAPVAGTGTIVDGLTYRGEIRIPYDVNFNSSSLRLTATDGRVEDIFYLLIPLGIQVDIHGVSEGDHLKGRVSFEVVVLQHVEGIEIHDVTVLAPPPDLSMDHPPFPAQCRPIDVRWEGNLTYSFDSADLPVRSDIIYFVVLDEMGYQDYVDVLDISREERLEETGTYTVMFAIILILPVAIIVLAVLRARREEGKRRDPL